MAGARRANWRSALVSTSIYDRPPLRHQINTKPERTSHTRSTLDPTSIGVHRTCWGSRRVVKCKNYSEPMLISTGFWLFRRGQNMEFCFEDRVSSRRLGQMPASPCGSSSQVKFIRDNMRYGVGQLALVGLGKVVGDGLHI